MAKKERISINAFERVMKESNNNVITFDWHGINVTVTKVLPFKEVVGFVHSVANSCFTDNNVYIPESLSFAIKTSVLERYANFTMPADVNLQYDLIYRTDAFDEVVSRIDNIQLMEIQEAINATVNNRIKANAEVINKQMNELYAAFDNIQKQLTDIFSGIGSDDLKNLVGAMSNGKLDEEKLMTAYINTVKKTSESE